MSKTEITQSELMAEGWPKYTTVDHVVRLSMGISEREIVFCETVFYLERARAEGEDIDGWANKKRGHLAWFLNVSKQGLIDMIGRMVKVDFIEVHPLTGRLRTTQKFQKSKSTSTSDFAGKPMKSGWTNEVKFLYQDETEVKKLDKEGKETLPSEVKKLYQSSESGKETLPLYKEEKKEEIKNKKEELSIVDFDFSKNENENDDAAEMSYDDVIRAGGGIPKTFRPQKPKSGFQNRGGFSQKGGTGIAKAFSRPYPTSREESFEVLPVLKQEKFMDFLGVIAEMEGVKSLISTCEDWDTDKGEWVSSVLEMLLRIGAGANSPQALMKWMFWGEEKDGIWRATSPKSEFFPLVAKALAERNPKPQKGNKAVAQKREITKRIVWFTKQLLSQNGVATNGPEPCEEDLQRVAETLSKGWTEDEMREAAQTARNRGNDPFLWANSDNCLKITREELSKKPRMVPQVTQDDKPIDFDALAKIAAARMPEFEARMAAVRIVQEKKRKEREEYDQKRGIRW